MELWEYNIKKSEENLLAARRLFEDKNERFIPLSAFHAQQCVELAVKAMAIKHGFEQYFIKKESKRQEKISKRSNYKKSHIPVSGLTSEIYDFVIESFRNIDRTQFDKKFADAIDESILKIGELKEFFKRIAKNTDGDEFEEVWLYSMGINSSDRIIEALDSYKKSCDTKLSKELCQGASNLARKCVLELAEFCRKNHSRLKFEYVIKEVKRIMVDYNLSENVIDGFLEGEEQFRKTIQEMVDKLGELETVDFLLNPKGFLTVFEDSRLPSKILQKWDVKKRINFIWLSHLVAISPTVIFLFPHVIIGRYPRKILINDNTEDLYKKHSFRVKELIDEAESTFNRIKKVLER